MPCDQSSTVSRSGQRVRASRSRRSSSCSSSIVDPERSDVGAGHRATRYATAGSGGGRLRRIKPVCREWNLGATAASLAIPIPGGWRSWLLAGHPADPTGDQPTVPRTPFLALAGVALTLVALSGCGSSNSSSSSSTAATTTTPAHVERGVHCSAGQLLDRRLDRAGQRRRQPLRHRVRPDHVGKLQAGQMLVSNFNAKESAKQTGQGTGTTIVQVSTDRQGSRCSRPSTPSRCPGPCPGGVGLTTALNILPGGYVIVGSLPTTNGKTATAKYGCLIVLNSDGKPVSTIASNNIQGPWDSTAKSEGAKTTLFVSNALNGGAAKGKNTINNSTVLRIDLESGAGQARRSPANSGRRRHPLGELGRSARARPDRRRAGLQRHALRRLHAGQQDPRGPRSGDPHDAVAQAASRLTEGGHLKEPLGSMLAPNGNIITTNGGDGNIVETTPAGQQVAVPTARQEDRRRLALRPRGQPRRQDHLLRRRRRKHGSGAASHPGGRRPRRRARAQRKTSASKPTPKASSNTTRPR